MYTRRPQDVPALEQPRDLAHQSCLPDAGLAMNHDRAWPAGLGCLAEGGEARQLPRTSNQSRTGTRSRWSQQHSPVCFRRAWLSAVPEYGVGADMGALSDKSSI